MKKRLLALAMVLVMVVGVLPMSVQAASTSYKTWSQGDSEWGSLLMGGSGSDTMKKAGCLITAVAKMLIYSGQQKETFTPGKCLQALKDCGMLTSGGAMISGNYNKTFLPTYAPELKHESSAAHSGSPWNQSKAVSEISGKLNNSYYVIVCVNNTSTGNTHWMLVDRVENNDVYVMDNGGVVPLYGTQKYSGGVIDQSYFKYSGTSNKPPVAGTSTSSSSASTTSDSPNIAPTTEPGQNMPQGQPFYFKGKITSGSKITSATISILSADGKTKLQTKTITPNTTTVDIATSGLDALKFGQLSPGSYIFYLTATNQSGKTSTWQKGFSIAGSTSSTTSTLKIAPTTEPGQNLPQGQPFYFKGNITSNYSITSATISILSADGKTKLQTKTITPNTTTVDIATSGLDALKFGQLSPGSYVFYLTATDKSGKTATWQKGFSIAGSTSTPAPTPTPTPAPTPTPTPTPTPAPQEQPKEEGRHSITINYYIDNKLVLTDHSHDGDGDNCYIYEMPKAYHNYSFWSITSASGIGVFATELWIPGLSSDATIDLYANSDGSTPEQFVTTEPAICEVTVIYEDVAGKVLNRQTVTLSEGNELYYPFDPTYNGYGVVALSSDEYNNINLDWDVNRIRIPAVYRSGTICLTYGVYQDENTPATSGNIGNFKMKNNYYDGLFRDVSSQAWYSSNIATAYRLGLMNGRGSNTFAPSDNMTIAEVVALAARVHSIYYTKTDSFPTYDGGNWYDPYVDYARNKGIINENYNFDRPATREQVVHILAKALPETELVNTVGHISFADNVDITYMADVRLLSGAGIINGFWENGLSYFKPLEPITRAQVAAIVGRMVQPSTRVDK